MTFQCSEQKSSHPGSGHNSNHGSLKSYATGLFLSCILTAIPFWLVISKNVNRFPAPGLVLLGFAVLQIVVHMVYFLHMNTKSEGGWSILALIFTVILVLIMLFGSVWVMDHLNHNMMPEMVN